jgi:hypothetical protein
MQRQVMLNLPLLIGGATTSRVQLPRSRST